MLKAGPRTLAREKYFRRTPKGKAWIRRTYLPKARAWEDRLDKFEYARKKEAGQLGEVVYTEFTISNPAYVMPPPAHTKRIE